jgi:hypothetical protein
MALRFPTHSHGQIVVLQCTEGELGKRRKGKQNGNAKGIARGTYLLSTLTFQTFQTSPFLFQGVQVYPCHAYLTVSEDRANITYREATRQFDRCQNNSTTESLVFQNR